MNNQSIDEILLPLNTGKYKYEDIQEIKVALLEAIKGAKPKSAKLGNTKEYGYWHGYNDGLGHFGYNLEELFK